MAENGDFDGLQANNVQVKEDISVAGQVDMGGKFSMGPGYTTFTGDPVGVEAILLLPVPAPDAHPEGALIFLDENTRKVTIRASVADGGELLVWS